MEGLRFVRVFLPHKIVAIGGLTLDSAASVYGELGVEDGLAMAGGLMDEKDPCATAQKIQSMVHYVRGSL